CRLDSYGIDILGQGGTGQLLITAGKVIWIVMENFCNLGNRYGLLKVASDPVLNSVDVERILLRCQKAGGKLPGQF
ncbi:hypothetical protein NE664_13585, partial [Anaerotignum faecicola]|nr:hypothetical protein [Anaerotignum faecicola]